MVLIRVFTVELTENHLHWSILTKNILSFYKNYLKQFFMQILHISLLTMHITKKCIRWDGFYLKN